MTTKQQQQIEEITEIFNDTTKIFNKVTKIFKGTDTCTVHDHNRYYREQSIKDGGILGYRCPHCKYVEFLALAGSWDALFSPCYRCGKELHTNLMTKIWVRWRPKKNCFLWWWCWDSKTKGQWIEVTKCKHDGFHHTHDPQLVERDGIMFTERCGRCKATGHEARRRFACPG